MAPYAGYGQVHIIKSATKIFSYKGPLAYFLHFVIETVRIVLGAGGQRKTRALPLDAVEHVYRQWTPSVAQPQQPAVARTGRVVASRV